MIETDRGYIFLYFYLLLRWINIEIRQHNGQADAWSNFWHGQVAAAKFSWTTGFSLPDLPGSWKEGRSVSVASSLHSDIHQDCAPAHKAAKRRPRSVADAHQAISSPVYYGAPDDCPESRKPSSPHPWLTGTWTWSILVRSLFPDTAWNGLCLDWWSTRSCWCCFAWHTTEQSVSFPLAQSPGRYMPRCSPQSRLPNESPPSLVSRGQQSPDILAQATASTFPGPAHRPVSPAFVG